MKTKIKTVDWLIIIGMSYILGFSFKQSGIGWLKITGLFLIVVGFLASLSFAATLYYKYRDEIKELKQMFVKMVMKRPIKKNSERMSE